MAQEELKSEVGAGDPPEIEETQLEEEAEVEEEKEPEKVPDPPEEKQKTRASGRKRALKDEAR